MASINQPFTQTQTAFQNSAEEVKQEILRKLDKIDIESIIHLSGSPYSLEDTALMNSWYLNFTWTVWRR